MPNFGTAYDYQTNTVLRKGLISHLPEAIGRGSLRERPASMEPTAALLERRAQLVYRLSLRTGPYASDPYRYKYVEFIATIDAELARRAAAGWMSAVTVASPEEVSAAEPIDELPDIDSVMPDVAPPQVGWFSSLPGWQQAALALGAGAIIIRLLR